MKRHAFALAAALALVPFGTASAAVTPTVIFDIGNVYGDGGATPAGAVSGSASCADLAHEMRAGSLDVETKGEVTRLQAFLKARRYLESEPTGYFGPLTQAAVIAFQKKAKIEPANGVVGALTRTAIRRESCGGSAKTTLGYGVGTNSVSFDFSPVTYSGSDDEEDEEEAPEVVLRLDAERVKTWDVNVVATVKPSTFAKEEKVDVWELTVQCGRGVVALLDELDRCGDTIAVYADSRAAGSRAPFEIASLRLVNSRAAKTDVKLTVREFDSRGEELERDWKKVKLGAAPR
jgi:hypothetical protein